MRKETTLVLAGITAVMLAFIVLYEQNTLSTGELESRRGQVLERFVRPRVHGIRIERGDAAVALVRDQEAEETLDTFDVGTWTLTEPVEGPADPDAIDSLLLACESLSARRTIEHVSDEDRARFGLDAPRAVLTFAVADETQVLRVGADDADLDATYVEVVGTDRVQIVGRDFFEAIDHDATHFRSKDLVADLAVRDVTALVLRYAHDDREPTEARLSLRDHRWVASAPFEGWARRSTVLEMIDAVVDARIARFVAEGDDPLLREPAITMTMTVRERDAEGRDTGRLREQAVVVGAPCPPVEGEDETGPLLAMRVDDGPTVCVGRTPIEGLLGSEVLLRETRLVAANDDQVERIVFGTGDHASLEVRRDDDTWEVIEEAQAARPADDQAVAEYLGLLHAAEAESFEDIGDGTLASHGLETPRMRIRVHHSDDDTIVEYVDVGSEDTVGVWVRRGDEPVVARYVGAIAELLVPSPLRFRARGVITREADDVLRLSITRDGVEERLATENGAWRIEAPYALAADRIATRDLVRELVSLRASRWVAEGDAANAGLSSSRLRVRIELREGHQEDGEPDAATPPLPTSIELVVGADTEGGAFARIEGEPAVFVLPIDVLTALRRPLVDREIVSLDTASATRITITRGAETVSLEKRDGVWYAGENMAAPDATDAFLERLRSLRARGVVSYGASASFTPAIAITVESADASRRLEIGGSTGEGAEAWAPARVSDVSAELQLAAETVTALASYRP